MADDEPLTPDAMVAESRTGAVRLTPRAAWSKLLTGGVLVDIRPMEQRVRDGEIEGSLVIEQNVVEWRLATTSATRLAGLPADAPVIVLCNEGYASSLVAANLRRLGLPSATDVAGGFVAWCAAGLPVVPGGRRAIHEASSVSEEGVADQLPGVSVGGAEDSLA